jgi:Kelch motif
MDFCIISASASDNSSHQIYLYGGRNNDELIDDIYILSLPDFTWTRRMYDGASPRAFHTCHLVGQSQMITIGGANDTDFARGCDWESKGVAIYNLNTANWGSVYEASADPYEVPSIISQVVGGG